ncbi:MAG: universal stress protein [Oligoflexia bacterium]|nr:universal stress protein [Oligoflexia bacterium]
MHYKHILVTTDFSDASMAAFDIAAYQAKMEGSAITLLTVVPDWEVPPSLLEYVPVPEKIDEYRAQVMAGSEKRLTKLASEKFHSQKVSTHVLISSRSEGVEITDYARRHNCDLIVIATRGHGALASLVLGSTVQKVLLSAPCPVLVIPVRNNGK